MKKIIVILITTIAIASCEQKSMERADTADQMDAPMEAKAAQAQVASAQVPDIYSNGKKVIKVADYRFQVNSVKETTAALEQAILRFNGYIESSNLALDNPVLISKISIRVQQDFFDDLLKEIDKQAIFVNRRTITTDDVSKDFVDLESRLKTKREVEARYTEILRSKAGTIEELLAAEEKIGNLHEEIEATISRINYLKDQVSFSTLNLEFYQTLAQELVAVEAPGFFQQAGDALNAGLSTVKFVALGLLHAWPFLVALGMGVYVYFRKKKSFIKPAAKD